MEDVNKTDVKVVIDGWRTYGVDELFRAVTDMAKEVDRARENEAWKESKYDKLKEAVKVVVRMMGDIAVEEPDGEALGSPVPGPVNQIIQSDAFARLDKLIS